MKKMNLYAIDGYTNAQLGRELWKARLCEPRFQTSAFFQPSLRHAELGPLALFDFGHPALRRWRD